MLNAKIDIEKTIVPDCDYPIKLYLTSEPGIASGIELYGYPKYPAEMNFDLKEKKGF